MEDFSHISTTHDSLGMPGAVPERFPPQQQLLDPSAAGRPEPVGKGRWIALLVFAIAVLVGPYLVGHFVYQIRFNELKAGVDVATGTLARLEAPA